MAIAVHIRPGGSKTGLSLTHPGRHRDIDKTIAIVAIERIGHGALPGISGGKEIGISIVVVIGTRNAPCTTRIVQAEEGGHIRKAPLSFIAIKRMDDLDTDAEEV